MAGKFEVYADKAGKFRWRPKAGNSETVASGGAYEGKAAACSATPHSGTPPARSTSPATAS
jgi:uncharacterized protein YegP (UPF0339 family)